MKFVIPTYKRSDTISNKTLRVLREGLVESNDIWLFVASPEELKAYTDSVDENLFGQIVVGEIGIVNQRNFISRFFDEDTRIVEVDDDIETFEQLEQNDRSGINYLVPVPNIPEFCEQAFDKCTEEGAAIWGVYPVHNPFFMRHTITTDLKFIVGCFNGRFNRKDIVLTVEEKDDFERTMLYYLQDGKVVRYNNITFKTKFYNKKGGKGEEGLDRKAESLVAANHLVELFPNLCRLYTRKKSGYSEVKLRDRRVIGGIAEVFEPTTLFLGTKEQDNKVMESILSKLEFYHSRPRQAYCSKGNGTVLFGDTWKRMKGVNGEREPHRTKKGRFYTEFYRKNKFLVPIFQEYQKKYFPDFPYTQVQINKNWICPPHFDAKNSGESTLVAFGSYKFGDTCTFNEITRKIERFDARVAPIKMDGSKILHWVDPIGARGDRYSLVFYNMTRS